MAKKKPEWQNIFEAAAQIGVHYETLRRWIREGKVESRRRGTGRTCRIFVHRDTVAQLREMYSL